jgi:hypothetical protein
MFRPAVLALILTGVLIASTGCVLVDTPDVRVGVLSSPFPRAVEPADPTPTYAQALHRVIRQQEEVASQLAQHDWAELEDEASDWITDIRMLNGYAGAAHDPDQFRAYCDKLLLEAQTLRSAARRHDEAGCRQAIDACDPLLDEMSRTFPLAAADAPAPTIRSVPPPQSNDDTTRVP